MPVALYLYRFAYTAEAWAAMIENPQDRRDMLASRIFGFGGRLDGFWYAFGEQDGYALVELPDNVSAAAVSLTVTATGAFRLFETTVLMTVEELLDATTRATEFSYAKPGS
jgi:uncharacterized protein with GYD domain